MAVVVMSPHRIGEARTTEEENTRNCQTPRMSAQLEILAVATYGAGILHLRLCPDRNGLVTVLSRE